MVRNVIVGLGVIILLATIANCAEPNAAPEKKKPEIIQWVETETGKWMVHDIEKVE